MDEIHTHESIHFQQQIKQGVFQFYKQGFYEQYMYNGDPYTDFGTNEWWANFCNKVRYEKNYTLLVLYYLFTVLILIILILQVI